MKISFTTLGCPQWDLETILARAKEYGYDAVDFRCLKDQMQVYRLPEFSDRAEQTRDKIIKAGLEISAFSSGARMFNPDKAKKAASLEEVAHYAELCRFFGVEYIRVFGGRLEGAGIQDAVKVASDTLEEMAATTRPAWVGVETHDDWVNTALLARVLGSVQAKNVCVVWDLRHPYRLAGETPRQSYDNIGRYTRYTHVSDSRPSADGPSVPTLPGEGDVPLVEMIDLLAAGGYDGYLTLEWEKKWQPEIAEPEVVFPAYARFLRQQAQRRRGGI